MTKRKKNSPRTLTSDQDFLSVFEGKEPDRNFQRPGQADSPISGSSQPDEAVDLENFAELLEASFKQNNKRSVQKSSPMPLKKRLLRYPPPEAVLDLHGYTAIGAQVKTRSFIQTAKHQGFFTVKIIVGKGRHSDFGAVLPDVVEDEVNIMKQQALVLWFEWEKKTKTRSGALIVYLKQFEQFE